MNAYTLEILWSTTGKSGTSFIYAEGATLTEAALSTYQKLKAQEGITATTLIDAYAHAECDTMQPCRNGIL